MHNDTIDAVLGRLQALIARETGAPLGAAPQAEMRAILEGVQGGAVEARASAGDAASREVTLLIADLRGFTALEARRPAGEVVAALNRCLARLSEVVVRHQGTIEQFLGDSLRVVFGAPVPRDDDVERALVCAVEMQLAMRDLNLEHLRERLPQVYLGIGINTGAVMAGRFGSDLFSQYAVIGEEVNLASRIEAFSLRGQVLMSEATYQRCGTLVSATAPMQVYVKGKTGPVALRELVAIPARRLKVPRQEFRRSHRADTRVPCLCQLVQGDDVQPRIIHGMIIDVGYHGLQMELPERIEPQNVLQMEFDLTLVEHRAVGVFGRVVKIKAVQDRWVAGLEFTEMGEETRQKVQMFVQLLVAAR
ncbi:MAG: adenylate/guanylate cyclase domain-containing protein [Giesbergeria sp.]|nr:adenylate/guanylate cyclase domain-containing protein [Giesbergeria sp.]